MKNDRMLTTAVGSWIGLSAGLLLAVTMAADGISARAKKLHFSSIVVDTHDDTTQRFLDGKFDLGPRDANGSIDIPRMKEGNLDAIFFSISAKFPVSMPLTHLRSRIWKH